MINFENLGFLAIFIIAIIMGLIIYIAYKVFIKKERPKNQYTPYDYIIGQTDKEFHDGELEEESEDKDENDNENKKMK